MQKQVQFGFSEQLIAPLQAFVGNFVANFVEKALPS
jgi:hypothetical protein